MSDLIESCIEFVRRIARCLIELGKVRANELFKRITRYLIEQSAVWSLLVEMLGI